MVDSVAQIVVAAAVLAMLLLFITALDRCPRLRNRPPRQPRIETREPQRENDARRY